jgi:hypothetical protein
MPYNAFNNNANGETKMAKNQTVYLDQDQDGDEEYLQSWTVFYNGESESFTDYRDAQETAAEWAEEFAAEIVDGGSW